MLFAFPYALLGAVTIAGLVAIYTFRARARRKPCPTSSGSRRARQRGSRMIRYVRQPLLIN